MGVLHLYLHQGIALDPLDLQQTQLQSMHPYFFGNIPWFLMWFTNPLGVMFHNKSSVCSFTPCAIFQPLIIFCHSITKTQSLSKVPLCIFHDANHYKNNQNDHKQVNWSHSNHLNFIKSWFFFISDMVIFPCHSITKTLILNMDWYSMLMAWPLW